MHLILNPKHKQATMKYSIFILIFIFFGNLLSMKSEQKFDKEIELKIKELEQNYNFEIAENYERILNHKQKNFLKEALIKKNFESLSKLINKEYLTEKRSLHLQELSTTKISGITKCAISPDFKFAITNQFLLMRDLSMINNITLLSLKDSEEEARKQTNKFTSHHAKFTGQEVRLMSISPDSKFALLESGCRLKHYINFWNLESLTSPSLLSLEICHKKSITSIAISPNCNFVITGAKDNTACLWNIEHPDQPYKKTTYVHKDNVEHVGLNEKFVITSSGNRAFLWDINAIKLKNPKVWNAFEIMDGPVDFIKIVATSVTGKPLFKIPNLIEEELNVFFINADEIITALAISKKDNVIIGYSSGKIASWDISNFTKPIYSYINSMDNYKIRHENRITTIQIADNNLVLVFSEDRITIFDLLSKNILLSKIINTKDSDILDQLNIEKHSSLYLKSDIKSAEISQNGELLIINKIKDFTLYNLFENMIPLANDVTISQLMLLIKLSKLNTYTNELESEIESKIFKTLDKNLQDQIKQFKDDLNKKQILFTYVSPVPSNLNYIVLNQHHNNPNNDKKHINALTTDNAKIDTTKDVTDLKIIYEDKLQKLESDLKKLKDSNDLLKELNDRLNSTKEKAFSQKINTNLTVKHELDNISLLTKLEEIGTKKEKEVNDLKQKLKELEEKLENQSRTYKYLEYKDNDGINLKYNKLYPITLNINELFLSIVNNINIKTAQELEENLLPEEIIILKQKFIKKYKKFLEKLSIFSLKVKSYPIILGNHNHFVKSVALGKNGLALTGGYDYSVKVWDIEDLSKIKQLATDNEIYSCSALAIAPNEKYGLIGSYDGSFRVLDFENQKQLNIKSQFSGHKGLINCIKFSSNGQYAATCSNDCTILIWKIEEIDKALNNSKPYIIIVCQSPTNALDFSPDNKYILSSSNDDLACIWDIEKITKITQLDDTYGKINTVAFNKNFLALTNSDENILLWDLNNINNPIKKSILIGHTDQVNSAMFSQNGNYIVSGSNDRNIKVWDITNPLIPINLSTLTSNMGNVLSIALGSNFNFPNDLLILTGSDDNFVRLWSFKPDNNVLINLSLTQLILLIKITQLSKYNKELENPENEVIFHSLSDIIKKELRDFASSIN